MILGWKPCRQAAKKIPFAVSLVRLMRATVDPHARSIWILEHRPNSGLLQPSPMTEPDRYPDFFGFIAERLADASCPRLLSYGCATGEELFSLHRALPQATLRGIDINPNSIRLCRKALARDPLPGADFVCAASPQAEPDASYDAIFCMAVTRHGALEANRPECCDEWLNFADFERLVADFARCLKPQGYLILWHSHFRLADTSSYEAFDVVLRKAPRAGNERLAYGPDHRRIHGSCYDEAIFQKR